MNQNAQQPAEINFRDLMFLVLKKAGIIALCGIVFAGLLFGYRLITDAKNSNVLDTSVKLDGESDFAYSERVLNIDHAKDLVSSIDALNVQIENQRDYVANSLFMQINAENEAVTTIQIIVNVDENVANGMGDSLVSAYVTDIQSGEYLSDLAGEFGTNPGYLAELIRIEYPNVNSVVVSSAGDNGSAKGFVVSVIGPTTEYTNKVMDLVVSELDKEKTELSEAFASHSLTVSGRRSSYKVDNRTRDQQYSVTTRFETIQKQISINDDALDELVSKIGVSDKAQLYVFFSSDSGNEGNSSASLRSAVKYAVIGFVIGAFLAVFVTVAGYVFGTKVHTQAFLFSRFPWINRIGVVNPVGKKSGYVRYLEKKTEDYSKISDSDNNRLIAANLKNLTKGMNKVLLTGTAEPSRIEELAKKLSLKADVKASFFGDPASLEALSDYDGVVIVEQRNYSDCREIKNELMLIANTDTKLIGAIVI